MDGIQPTPESSGASPEESHPPRRILACVLCQQRKIKCEKRFPCSQCIHSGSECVPAAALGPRQRRPRFPERALLDRLHKYEDLLRDHNIEFEPMHKDPNAPPRSYRDKKSSVKSGHEDSEGHRDGLGSENEIDPKDFWDTMKQGFQISKAPNDPPNDIAKQVSARQQWDGLYDNNDHLFFGLNKSSVSIRSLHPPPAEALRLWQIYLDNVNTVLKITHTPSLQPRVIEAVGDFTRLDPSFEALLFSIYCVAVQTLTEDESMTIFKSPRDEILSRYQLGCQNALANCGYLRTVERDCLTGQLLYLFSIGLAADPRALSATLGVTMRIAMRMGLHSEAALAKLPPFEIEMRRRLWWALALFDARIGELSDYKNMGLSPVWDCKPPLNVNDSELWPDMKELPAAPSQTKPSEALFAASHASLMDVVRRTSFYLDFSGPAFKGLAGKASLSDLEAMMEDRFLKSCDTENPDHCMAKWACRTKLARYQLMEHYSKQGGLGPNLTDAQRDTALGYAFSYLENDTKMVGCTRLKRYDWYHCLFFPLPGYIHVVFDLRMRPLSAHSARAWDVLGANYNARFRLVTDADNPRFRSLANLILMAWDARVMASPRGSGTSIDSKLPPPAPPPIVSAIHAARSSSPSDWTEDGNMAQQERRAAGVAPAGGDLSASTAGGGDLDWAPVEFTDSLQYGMDWQADLSASLGMAADANLTQLNWAAMGWDLEER